MTDMAVAADNVIFGLPEVKSVFLCSDEPAAVDRAATLVNEWALTGEPFDAKARSPRAC